MHMEEGGEGFPLECVKPPNDVACIAVRKDGPFGVLLPSEKQQNPEEMDIFGPSQIR